MKLPLTKRYIPAVASIAIFIILSHYLTNELISSNNDYAKLINISGKQRMLSQRLVILGANFNKRQTTKAKIELEDALKEIETAHKYLLTKIVTPKMNSIYFENGLDRDLRSYLLNFHDLLIATEKNYVEHTRDYSKFILIQLDSVVKEYERYANEQLEILEKNEFYLMLATLFVLVIEVVFVFTPAANQIEQDTSKLAEKQEYEYNIVESNSTAIIAIDWTGRIITYNIKAQEVFGWTKKEMLGKRNLSFIIPDKHKKSHANSSKKYLTSGESCGIMHTTRELEGLKKDGTIFPIRISFGGKYKPKGSIVTANIADITEEKEREHFMIQQAKMASLGEMLGNIAHQWRQPLSTISTSASGVVVKYKYGVLKDEDIPEHMETIKRNAQFLSETIDTFGDFIKEDKRHEEVILQDKIINILKITETTLKENYIELKNNIDQESPVKLVMATGELSQVIINIINNAKDVLIENQIKNPWIKLGLKKIGKKVILTIEDNGRGIPKEVMSKIFDPYFTTKHKSQGTGLGLHMSQKIIQNSLHGNLYVKNTKNGAKFFIELPIA